MVTTVSLLLSSAFVLSAAGSDSSTVESDQIVETVDQEWIASVWVNVSRVERLFGPDGDRIGHLEYSWDGASWVPISGRRETKVEEGDLEWTVTEHWNGASWDPEYRLHRIYDENDQVLEETRQDWRNDEWTNQIRRLYRYEGGNQTEERSQGWDGSDWYDAFLRLTEYDEVDRQTSLTSVRLSGETPENVRRTSWSYSTGSAGEEIVQITNEVGDGDGWRNEQRHIESFRPDGQRLEEIDLLWLDGQWTNYTRVLRTYDSAGNNIERTKYTWPTGASDWEAVAYNLYSYDVQNRITSELAGVWSNGIREDMSRATYRYDPSGLRKDVDREEFRNGAWERDKSQWWIYDDRGNEIEEGVSNWNGREFVNQRRSLHTYLIPSGTSEDGVPQKGVLASIQNFPNPFSASTDISYNLPVAGRVHLSVVDVLGRTVVVLVDGEQYAGRFTTTWHASASAGVYFARLETASGVSTRKMVVWRK